MCFRPSLAVDPGVACAGVSEYRGVGVRVPECRGARGARECPAVINAVPSEPEGDQRGSQ